VLHEVELLVRGRGPEVIPHDCQRLALLIALFIDHANARLLAERRIREYEIEATPGIGAKTVVDFHRRFDLAIGRSDAV